MTRLIPHVREAGAGPGVVCVHSNASTSTQWRALMERLSPQYHVLAADSLGAGQSPAWPGLPGQNVKARRVPRSLQILTAAIPPAG